MKVLEIITGNDIGGGGKHVLDLCYYSKDLFHTVLGCIGEGPLYNKAKKLGVKTTLFSSKSFINNEIQKYIKNNNIDIVNFHGAKAFFTHYFVNKRLSIPSVATVHSNYKEDFLNNKYKYYLFTPLSIRGIKSFKNHICVSNYIKDILNNDNVKSRKFIINNGIDLNYYEGGKCNNDLRVKLNIKKEEFIYIMVARMHPIKNHKLLIEAFHKLTKEYKNIKLLLAGEGVEEEKLKEKVKNLNLDDKVLFLGFKDNIEDYLEVSDISVLTSLNEGGSPPLVILESGIKKVPVIASNVGDIPFTINRSNGFLINPTSMDDIYDKMKEAYNNKNELNILGENLYNTVISKYSMKNFCKSYYECYKNLI